MKLRRRHQQELPPASGRGRRCQVDSAMTAAVGAPASPQASRQVLCSRSSQRRRTPGSAGKMAERRDERIVAQLPDRVTACRRSRGAGSPAWLCAARRQPASALVLMSASCHPSPGSRVPPAACPRRHRRHWKHLVTPEQFRRYLYAGAPATVQDCSDHGPPAFRASAHFQLKAASEAETRLRTRPQTCLDAPTQSRTGAGLEKRYGRTDIR